MTGDRAGHWDKVFATRPDDAASWHEAVPQTSIDLLLRAGFTPGTSVIDIGGGASRLVDHLLALGAGDMTVLDIAAPALATARARLGTAAERVVWIAADVTRWQPARRYDIWHDRAAFHFLTDPEDRAAYVAALHGALGHGGHAVIATFAPDGPERCSGLPVLRYSPETLAAALGSAFRLVESRSHRHLTPSGAAQMFQFSLLRRN